MYKIVEVSIWFDYFSIKPCKFLKNDSILKVKQMIYNNYYIPIHRQELRHAGIAINNLSEINFNELYLTLTSPNNFDFIDVKFIDKRKYNSEGGIEDFNIIIDLKYKYEDIYKEVIKAKQITKKIYLFLIII